MAGSGWGLQGWWNARTREAVWSNARVTLAMAGIMAFGVLADRPQAIIPLLLGTIASALAETDDNWRGRTGAQLMTLLCFFVAIHSVQLGMARPPYLAPVLVMGAFLLTLLGALGDRYRTIAAATLIMALYAALAMGPGTERELAAQRGVLLFSGAIWHGMVSVLWAAAFPTFAVRESLANLYETLGKYLELKSRMLEPVRNADLEQCRLQLALYNGRLVDALNATKEILFVRASSKPDRMPPWLVRALHRYFTAQDVHERTSSSHEHYDLLAKTFFHSDVLYRCERVLALLGQDCIAFAGVIRERRSWERDEAAAHAVEDMNAAVAHIEPVGADELPETHRARPSLRALATNLGAIHREISGLRDQEPSRLPAEWTLQDIQPRTWRDFRDRLAAHLNLQSPIMRHAIRLGAALGAGYAVMTQVSDAFGFWILLTIVFVCQPYYGATLTRLAQRIAGTVLGLLAGWALLRLFPDPLTQSAFTVVAAVLFFAFRTARYAIATAGITMFVLLAFNQVGNGYDLIVPRLLDTLIGGGIAGVSVWLILPSWHSRRLPRLAAAALRAHSRYLKQLMLQYSATGKQDDLAYRIARRDAHNADATLSGALLAALQEPSHVRRGRGESGKRFIVSSHTLLNYLSALGAHRPQEAVSVGTGQDRAIALERALENLAAALDSGREASESDVAWSSNSDAGGNSLPAGELSETQRVVHAQLALVARLMPTLRRDAAQLVTG